MLRLLNRLFADGRFANVRMVRMSDGHLALIRELGLVKGGRGLRHHERLISFSTRAAATFAMNLISKQRPALPESVTSAAPEAQA